MAVTYIFQEGEPVKSNEVNQDFADVLSAITEAVSGSSTTLDTKINGVKTTAESALSKANNSVQLSGNQTINGQKTFNNLVKVPNSTAAGSAISLVSVSKSGSLSCMELGCGVKIQWGHYTVPSSASDRGTKKISLAKSFSNEGSYRVVASYNTNGSNDATIDWNEVGVTAQTASNFTIRYAAYRYSNDINWIAIGY